MEERNLLPSVSFLGLLTREQFAHIVIVLRGPTRDKGELDVSDLILLVVDAGECARDKEGKDCILCVKLVESR